MTIDILITFLTIAGIFALLVFTPIGPEIVLFGGLAALILTGVLPVESAFNGFSNTGMLTVALLFVVSAAIQHTGLLDFFVGQFLGTKRQRNLSPVMLKFMAPIAFLSAFINNTPVVVIFTPVIKRWAEKIKISASKLLIPLDYATILGGTCTLIGTSTTLLVHGLALENKLEGLSFFELAKVGIPVTVVGILYLAFIAKNLLPDRKDVRNMVTENLKEYVVEMKIQPDSPLVGKSIRDAGLRSLNGLYLTDIERDGRSIGPVSSHDILQGGDYLIFVGAPSAIVDLQELPGLVPAAHEMFEQEFARMRSQFVEAVVSSNSPILGKTLKECDFRKRYGAGVFAVHRNGERIQGKIGSIRLKAGDTLLLFTEEGFLENWRDSQDFYLVSYLKDNIPKIPSKSYLALLIALVMIVAATFGVNILYCVLAAVVLLFVTGCINGREAKNSIRWDILIMIASAIGISKAIQISGTSDLIGSQMEKLAPVFGPQGALALIYLMTLLMTEILTNNAAVALAFPIAVATASHLGLDPKPFIVTIAIAASCGFASPIGYQTHLIVQGPGGYKFGDYVRAGLPLDFLVAAIAIFLIPIYWPF